MGTPSSSTFSKQLILLAVISGCAPRVQGKALHLTQSKRVAVVGKGYTQGIESALMAHGGGKVKVLARREKSEMDAEKQLQYSGDFSDDAMVGLGRQLGAELLFVVSDEVHKQEQRDQPSFENCAFRYTDNATDPPDTRAQAKVSRDECEKRNDAERKRIADTPPHVFHRYTLHVRAIDIATGEIAGYADVTVADGQAGMTCVYPCTKDKASDLAVRALFGLATKD